jgi:hypothetical protein
MLVQVTPVCLPDNVLEPFTCRELFLNSQNQFGRLWFLKSTNLAVQEVLSQLDFRSVKTITKSKRSLGYLSPFIDDLF